MRRDIKEVGYRAGLAACAATVAYDLTQLLQVAGLIHPPVDEILIYGTSLCIVVPFVLEMLALHHVTVGERRFWTHAAVVFTSMYAVFVSANYVVQLSTTIPARMRGDAVAIHLLEQTPHSMYWDYDAMGYIAMGIATLFAANGLPRSAFARRARYSLYANALVAPLIATVYFYPRFSTTLLFVGFPWAITAPASMLMLALWLRRTGLETTLEVAARRQRPPAAGRPPTFINASGRPDRRTRFHSRSFFSPFPFARSIRCSPFALLKRSQLSEVAPERL